MVPKKDGSWRPRSDYRRLNLVTTPEKYPLPNMQDLSNSLHGCTVFSKIDLIKGYHQIPVATADIPKTAIIMLFGLFEYLFTPFGLSNATQTFQRMMDHTTDGLEGVFAYMDDPRVCSLDRQTHLPHLEAFFYRLSNQWSCHKSGEMCCCSPFFGNSWPHDFGGRSGPHSQSHRRKRTLPSPSGHQTTTTFSRHGGFLTPFSAQMRTGLVPFDSSPEGRGQNVGVDRLCTAGFPGCKTPPGSGSATPTPRPNSQTFSCH
jgi:hypothetical protein